MTMRHAPCGEKRWLRSGSRLTKPAVVIVLCIGLAGCMALRLTSRGAPDDAMRSIELNLEAVDLPAAHGHGHDESYEPDPLWVTVPESGWLHAFDYVLLDANGDSVPSEVLHHFKVMDPSRRELFSPVMLHLAGAGAETKPVSLPPQVGCPLEKGDTILVTAMMHNPTGRDFEGVRLRITLVYSPRGPWDAPMSGVPFFVHVTPPMEDAGYDLLPGRSQTSIEVRPAVSGPLLGLGGHLHRYGVSLRLEDVTEGRVLWERQATRTADGTVLEIPVERFVWSRGPSLRSDHTYRVTATYDNPTGATIPEGGMGTLGGVLIPDGPWPDSDRRSPEYVWYLVREIENEDAPGRPSADRRSPRPTRASFVPQRYHRIDP
jgi:hypothetical protein